MGFSSDFYAGINANWGRMEATDFQKYQVVKMTSVFERLIYPVHLLMLAELFYPSQAYKAYTPNWRKRASLLPASIEYSHQAQKGNNHLKIQ